MINKWYNSLLINLKGFNKVFIYDKYKLLKDKNFFNDLSKIYKIQKIETESKLHIFLKNNQENKVLIYSNNENNTKFIQENFDTVNIDLESVFPDLDLNILNNMDVGYLQKIYDYYIELKSQNIFMETEYLIFKSIWDIDKTKLNSKDNLIKNTENLKIFLSYLSEDKDFDENILKIISKNLDIKIEDLRNKNIKVIEDIILEYINNINHNSSPQFDFNDNLIQFYLSKINLNKKLISKNINKDVLQSNPWLTIFKENSQKEFKEENSKEEIKNIINTNIKFFKEQFKLFVQLNNEKIDLNQIDDIFDLSKLFFKIIYKIQVNNFKFNEFIDIDEYYLKLNNLFKKIVEEDIFNQLIYYPHNKRPYTINKLLDYISYNLKDEDIVLIVFDGMSYDEWLILKTCLNSFEIKETESFAILPTITQYSRTSMLTGKLPKSFLNEKYQVKQNEEENGFKEYFKNKGKNKAVEEKDILFGKIDLNNNYIKTKKDKIEFEYLKRYKAIGLICNLFDDLAHETSVFGNKKSNLYKNIKNSIESSQIIQLLETLKESGYKIVISSDHGNIYCKGNGIKYNKNLEIDKKSKRTLIYNDEVFADKFIKENSEKVLKYHSNIFPKELFFILAINNEFFANEDNYSITHGSYMLEEWIVPVVILQ